MSHLLLPIPFQPLLQREYADILQQQFNKEPSSNIDNIISKTCVMFYFESLQDEIKSRSGHL